MPCKAVLSLLIGKVIKTLYKRKKAAGASPCGPFLFSFGNQSLRAIMLQQH